MWKIIAMGYPKLNKKIQGKNVTAFRTTYNRESKCHTVQTVKIFKVKMSNVWLAVQSVQFESDCYSSELSQQTVS
jgi:hypothetical protein